MKQVARKHTDILIEMERLWRDYLDKQDSGSYCETPSHEHGRAYKVWEKIRAARDAVQKYESER